jgi:N-methylhydantoinase A
MARKGVDPQDFVLIAFGGAGPTHALFLVREVGIGAVVVPPNPGTLCALGCLVMDLKSDFIKSLMKGLDVLAPGQLELEYVELEGRARSWLADERVPTADVAIFRTADMRYRGQSFDINVQLPSTLGADDAAVIRAAYDRTYRKAYGFDDPSAAVDVVNVRVTIAGRTAVAGADQPSAAPAHRFVAQPASHTRIFVDGGWVEAGVYERTKLRPGERFEGPAVVEQYDTTTLVLPAFTASVDQWGNLVIRRSGAHE